MRSKKNLILLPTVFALLSACAGPVIVPDHTTISTQELLRAMPLTGDTDLPELRDIDVLAVNQDMLEFLDQHVNRHHGRTLKLHELLHAIITDYRFGLKYDETTRTAQETFAARQGNCLSFTNMFVAMAREVGINATYQEIDIPPDWSHEGDIYMLTRHVNVVVDTGGSNVREVDFNIDDFQSSYNRQLISDERALAHYYSNIGAEFLQQAQPLEALRYFRKAAAADENYAPVWSNLGALYSRAKHFDYAEAAYLQALRLNPGELVAMSNLGQLYQFQGKSELANRYYTQSNQHRMQNPYYRYHLAREAFLGKNYEAAIKHLRYSLRKKKNEDTFYFLMGLSYLGKGDDVVAQRWLKRAEEIATDDGLRRSYHNKIERLFESG